MTTVVNIRPWSDGDLHLLERLLGDPAMNVHLGGPETPEQIRQRHGRYCRLTHSGPGSMFVITIGLDKISAGSVGFWEKEWQGEYDFEYPPGNFIRCNDWFLDLFADKVERG
jgi:hypothetical protein